MKKFIYIFICMLGVSSLSAQTADVTQGCIPLQVNFTAPSQTDYFWDFKDGTTSNVANPSHNFTDAGIYIVELFDAVGGTKIGEIEIEVFPDPDIKFTASSESGCSPFQVSFTNTSIVDPSIMVTGYTWDFGDGNNSNLENPNHTYLNEGTYTVTLSIQTVREECTTTKVFTDFISVVGNIDAGFSVDKLAECDLPAVFTFSNSTVDGNGFTYSWDFGNGETSTDFDPGSVTYTEAGTYLITFIVDNGQGCDVKLTRVISVGPPIFDMIVPDTVCIGKQFTIFNGTDANSFDWNFGVNGNPQNTNAVNPQVLYNVSGPQIVTFSAIQDQNCASDTFFTIYVDDPSAVFTIDPLVLCGDPVTYTFTHPIPYFKDYQWFIDTLELEDEEGNIVIHEYDVPDRDSFYIARPDTFIVSLFIETNAGCTAFDSAFFIHRAPEAHFVPNVTRGCAPLTVNFDELSKSIEPIISWDWTFGDGTTTSVNTPDDMTHTYTEPGEYYVKLSIENDAGCEHTSAGVWIYVGEPLTSEFTVDQTEICMYETINLEALNLDPRIDAYHFNTDNGQISHCYKSPITSHTFIHEPGTYPLSLTLEYNGCFSEIASSSNIVVNGSKSRIQYMTNCEDPFTVMFQDSSINAISSLFILNGDTISMDTIPGDVLNYTFDSTDVYDVYLITNDDTPCPADTSKVTVHIKDIQAAFELPEYICAEAPIEILATESVDVDNTCSKGYNWYGVSIRPRMLDTDTVEAAYPPGEHTIRLIVEDVNGCKDTLDKTTTALDITADFEADVEKACYPANIQFTDLSTSDTTITAWDWSFGSEQQNPLELFVDGTDDELVIQLVIVNELSCTDTIIKAIEIYEPTTDIGFSPATIVCIGETIEFTASDFNDEGSFLNFDWSFGELGDSEDQNPDVVVSQSGIFPVNLNITEDGTGCTNQYTLNIQGVEYPEASFTTDPADTEEVCYPAIIQFNNLSTFDGPGTSLWNLGDGTITPVMNPSASYEKGVYTVELIASSVYGCSDTAYQTVSLVGPEGAFETDKLKVCKGEGITFNLIDTVDVSQWSWDFGDGTIVDNDDFIEHAFNFHPPNGTTNVSLILKSGSNSCETIVVQPVDIFQVIAELDTMITESSICSTPIEFINNSTGHSDHTWNFGNGDTSLEDDPIYEFVEPGTYTVILNVSDEISGCTDADSIMLEVSGLDRADIPTVFSPNNDDINDYFDIIIREDQRECINVIKAKIYNRWGNTVYNNEMPPVGWDGRMDNGDVAPAEVYTYVMEIEYVDGEIEIFKGMFTLIK